MTGQDETRYVPVAEAAALLGVKPDSIRKRIRRRQLQAIKPPGSNEWLVLLDRVPPGQDSGQDTLVPVVQSAPVLSEWDALRRYHGTVLSSLEQLVAQQDERHAAVMAELAAVRAEIAALQDRTEDATQNGTRPWWAFWRRQ